MSLAAMSFADPMMLAGMLAAAIPLVLHLLNRIHAPLAPFPTLRFLKIAAEKTARRRQVQQYLLLLVRMAVFAMIAMAIARPLIRGGNAWMAYGFLGMFLGGTVLSVLGGVWLAAMKKQQAGGRSQKAPAGEEVHGRDESIGPGSHRAPVGAAPLSSLIPPSSLLLLGLLLAACASYALASDRYFSGDRGEFTGRSTAAVILLDNSHSMLAREDAATRWERAKEQVRQILAETVRPAEAGIVLTNPGGIGSVVGEDRLTGDLTRLLGFVDKVAGGEGAGQARPMKERVRAAAQMLENSQHANRMLIIVSDFGRSGGGLEDADVFSAFRESAGAKDLQVVLMPVGGSPADVGISKFEIVEGSGAPVAGSEVIFQAEVVNNGDAAEAKELSLLVDDVPVEHVRARVQLGPAGTGSGRTTVRVPYRLTQPGSHRFALRLTDANDAMAWNDQRELVLDVDQQVKVLVLGAEERVRERSAAYYFLTALEPFSGQRGDGRGDVAWSIVPSYHAAAQVREYRQLSGHAAVYLCDVPRVPVDLADALARYVKEGGRVVWVLGASVDGEAYNKVLLESGRDLLPGPLGQATVSAAGSTVDWVDLQSPLFANLFDSQEPFRSVVVTGRWPVAGGRGRALLKLADGSILLGHHAVKAGDVYTLLTSPSAAWSNLGATVLLVPMASRMALGDSARLKLETSYDPGAGLLIRVRGADRSLAGIALDVTTPTKAVIHTRAVMSGDVPRWYFDRTLAEGVYRWRASGSAKPAGMFVVNPPGEEVDLLPADVDSLAREVATNRSAIVARSPQELLTMLEKRSEGTSLTPGVIGMVMMLAVVEGLAANRRKG